MEKLILASNNKGKLRELKKLLGGRFEVTTLSDAGLKIDAEETGDTFEENALLKAKAVYDLSGIPALADDSGLCVEALGGAPGVYSARYCGRHGDDGANNALLLARMRGVENRACKFVSAVVLYRGDGDWVSAVGETRGLVLEQETGAGGFGYDPLFYSLDLGKSFGEATDEEKNAVSHRFRALSALVKKL